MTLRTLSTFLFSRTSFKFITCGALVIAADALFYKQDAGWTLGLFGLFMLVAILIHNPVIAQRTYIEISGCAALGLTLALIENTTALGVALLVFTLSALALLTQMQRLDDARQLLRSVIRYAFFGWFRLYHDRVLISHVRRHHHKRQGRRRIMITHWLLPIIFSAAFIMLFAEANPIITGWMKRINWQWFVTHISVERAIFWVFGACLAWAMIRPRLPRRKPTHTRYFPKHDLSLTALLFNERSIPLSLLLFNGLFLVQNVLDIAFLWSGVSLPDGMTHAAYAHQGAYPLVVTAILAACFVLIAFRPGSASAEVRLVRVLMYGWVGQNIFLVFSSMFRLANYVEDYSLTYLRIAAFIWMALVSLGLILIVARIALRKSNKWLINVNSLALYATLYLCCFINFGSIIAYYNVKNSFEVTGKGAFLDTYYLDSEVGVEAIPALIWLEQRQPGASAISRTRYTLQRRVFYTMEDWRRWTFRAFRLSRIAIQPVE